MATITTSFAQYLAIHQWENRLILIIADDKNNIDSKKQLAELQTVEKGLGERKILVYQILPAQFQQELKAVENWQKGNQLYTNYKKSKTAFEVQLIGLDGGQKLLQSTVLSAEKLFSMIDKMPMRRLELRRKNER
ncbi:MAG: hypothetical protein ACJAYJ_000578 [Saprospiraceae bacterium]|jgi:hypothetical protein